MPDTQVPDQQAELELELDLDQDTPLAPPKQQCTDEICEACQ